MEESNCELTSVKKMKLNMVDDESSKEIEEEPTQDGHFLSPITNPVLTPEIWDQIFRDLSGNDFLSVINAAPEWNRLLGSKKTTELFPMLIHHVLPYLEPNEMLACRGAQRDSKAAVDTFLETHALSDEIFSSLYESSLLPKMDTISDAYAQRGDELLEALAPRTKDPSYNPFLTRTLFEAIHFPVDIDEEEAAGEAEHFNMIEFLTCYGAHLWLLNFTFFERVDSNGVEMLSNYLSLTPTLKTLRLYTDPAGVLQLFGDDEFPLPPLEHLSCLDFRGFNGHSVVSRFIQRYGTQLTTLLVSGDWIKSSNIEASTFKDLLPKLKRLRVDDVDTPVLEKLSVVDWPVEALHLQIGVYMWYKQRQLLTTISNFKASLRQLELNLLQYFYGGAVDFDYDELLSIQEKEDEEAMAVVQSAFKQSTIMEKLVAYWEITFNDDDGENIHSIKIVKPKSDESVDENQFKIIRTSID